ncbi:MAG TPA: hypothetical protein VL484_20670 [Vicinamibacterales bacterium]|jgi:hypothetical protein|nr:hypothetical protein [Vicinamibacterales bacterium]
MRLIIASLVAVACCSPATFAFQTSGTARAKSSVRACSLLTKELIKTVTPEDTKALDIYFTGAPEEDSLGAGGTDCAYGGIAIQIDPNFSYDTFKRQTGWEHAEPVVGLGDEALFHDNIGEWAELIVRSGAHLLTIRMDVPRGRTAESIKPNVIALAKALLPKIQ